MLLSLLTAACSESGPQPLRAEYIYRFPLLKNCESIAKQKLDSFAEKSAFDYRIVKFDDKLASHPDLVGYVELFSNKIEEPFLEMDVNSFAITCYPNTWLSVAKDAEFANSFAERYQVLDRLDVKERYVVDMGNQIRIYYHRP